MWSVNFLLINGHPKSQSFPESSHKKLNMILKVKQPKFYRVTEQLANQLVETSVQIQHHKQFGQTPKKRSDKYNESDKRIIEILTTVTRENVFDKLKLISSVLRQSESSRARVPALLENLPEIANNSLAVLPIRAIQPTVQHPQVQLGTLPARTRRSNEATRSQEEIVNQTFEDHRVDEAYDLMDVDYGEYGEVEYEYLEEESQEIVAEADDGYCSGADTAENQQLDVVDVDQPPSYECDVCFRGFNTSRGLNIHKAVHKQFTKRNPRV